MAGYAEQVQALIEPALEAMGYELVGVQHRSGGARGLLRIYIDSRDGVTVDDCERVSHQVSGILDVEDPLPGQYTLEVSSPGLDRPLFRESDYQRFAGATVRVRLIRLWQGRRRFEGVLGGLHDGCVLLTEEDGELSIPLELVESARLKPDLSRLQQ